MASGTEYVMIEGYKDQITTYKFQLKNLEFDGKKVSVDLLNVRNGDSAIMEDCEYNLYIDGELVDQKTGSPFDWEEYTRELSGQANGGEDLTLEFYSPYWHNDATNIDNWGGYVRFETKVPDISTLVNLKDIKKPQEARQDEQWKFDIEVENTTSNKLDNIDIFIEVTDSSGNSSSEVQGVSLSADSITTLRLWSGDIKSMFNTSKIDKGDLKVCASIR